MIRTPFIAIVVAGCAASVASQETHYAAGQPHEEYQLRNGVRHGKARVWHSTGKLALEGTYVAGKREGTFVFFDAAGEFEYQAVFHSDEEIWRSTDRGAKPDLQQLTIARQRELAAIPTPTSALPLPWFSSIDRTTSLDRAGAQLGFGGPAGLGFGSARRFDIFANYMRGELGGYGQLSQTTLEAMSGRSLSGAWALEGGGTYLIPYERFGAVTARLGLLVPFGDGTTASFAAATSGALQRPADGTASVPATLAVRTSSNLTRVGRRFVFQADAGIDWLLGGASAAFEPFARANAAVGFGGRSGLIGVEVANTVSITDLDHRLHGAGLSGGVRLMGIWVSALLSYSINGDAAFTTGLGYEL